MRALKSKAREKMAESSMGCRGASRHAGQAYPNADKLSLCRVNDGQGEAPDRLRGRQLKPGDKVPLILPRSEPARQSPASAIQPSRWAKSAASSPHGMMCSPQELALPDQVEGLLILRAEPGSAAFAEVSRPAGQDVAMTWKSCTNRPRKPIWRSPWPH